MVVGALAARTARGYAAVGLCGFGVAAVSNPAAPGATAGLVFAAAAACAAGAKLILTNHIATSDSRRPDLAAGLIIGTVLFSPLSIRIGGHWSWALTAQVFAIGVLSTVVPYLLDQAVSRLVGAGGLAVLAGLLPVTAALFGYFLLQQDLTPAEVAGVLLVGAAVILKARDATAPPRARSGPGNDAAPVTSASPS